MEFAQQFKILSSPQHWVMVVNQICKKLKSQQVEEPVEYMCQRSICVLEDCLRISGVYVCQ